MKEDKKLLEEAGDRHLYVPYTNDKKVDFCPLCGRKVGKGNYDKEHGCGECGDMSE